MFFPNQVAKKKKKFKKKRKIQVRQHSETTFTGKRMRSFVFRRSDKCIDDDGYAEVDDDGIPDRCGSGFRSG